MRSYLLKHLFLVFRCVSCFRNFFKVHGNSQENENSIIASYHIILLSSKGPMSTTRDRRSINHNNTTIRVKTLCPDTQKYTEFTKFVLCSYLFACLRTADFAQISWLLCLWWWSIKPLSSLLIMLQYFVSCFTVFNRNKTTRTFCVLDDVESGSFYKWVIQTTQQHINDFCRLWMGPRRHFLGWSSVYFQHLLPSIWWYLSLTTGEPQHDLLLKTI